jgi:Family of unknown function (DUF6496)
MALGTPRRNLFANASLPKQFRKNKEEHMAKSTPRQRRTEGRVMHEFKHGELKSGRGGKAGKVKSRKQAIAIALSEAGASKYDSKRKQRHNRTRSAAKEARGRTGQQEKEGKRHIGARGQRESTRAEGGKNARRRTASGKRAARSRVRGGPTKQELYKKAQKRHIPNRSKMTKTQLENALKRAG